jgi:hypothetical protein
MRLWQEDQDMEGGQDAKLGCRLWIRGCRISRIHHLGSMGVWPDPFGWICRWYHSLHSEERRWHVELGYLSWTWRRCQCNQLGPSHWALHAQSWTFLRSDSWLFIERRYVQPATKALCLRRNWRKDQILALHWQQILNYKRDRSPWWLDSWCLMEQQHRANARYSG